MALEYIFRQINLHSVGFSFVSFLYRTIFCGDYDLRNAVYSLTLFYLLTSAMQS